MRLFVYGTLLTGERNHDYLRGCQLLGPALTAAAYQLVSLGPYPALLVGGGERVAGEVYEICRNTLNRLDELEGHPDLYLRSEVLLADGSTAVAYLLPRERAAGARIVPGGRWRDRGWVSRAGREF